MPAPRIEGEVGRWQATRTRRGARYAAALRSGNGMPRVHTLPASWVARPQQGKAKGQPRREQPIRRATAESPPDPCINDRLEPAGLPEHAKEAGVAGGLPVDTFAIDLGNHEGVLPLRAYECQVSQLDFHPGALDDRGIGGDKGPIPPRRGGQQA